MQRLLSVLTLLALPAGTDAQSADIFLPEIIYQEVGCKPQRPTANRGS